MGSAAPLHALGELRAQLRWGVPVLALALLLFPATSAPATADASRFEGEIVKVADGVWAAVQPDRLRFVDCTAGIVELGDGLMIVDSFVMASKARSLIEEIRKLSPRPVRWVVSTHFHGDHVQGNQAFEEAFPGQVTFIAHTTVREDVMKRAEPVAKEELEELPDRVTAVENALSSGKDAEGKPFDAEMKARYERTLDYRRSYLENLRNLRFVLPSLTYDSRLVLTGGDREVRLIHERAHTRGDTVVYLPRERVLFTGDLLDDLPYVGHGYPSEWIQTLRALATLEIDQIVPGHGRPYQGKERLVLVADFLESIVTQVKAALGAGRGENDVRGAVIVEPFRSRLAGSDPLANRTFDEFVPEAIVRAFQEATGRIEEAGQKSE